MSDDLVKQSIAELQDIVRCRCHHVYKDRGMHDPDCECDSADAVQAVADRIDELEAELRSMALDCLAADGQATEAYQAQLAAEAKLAKAMKAFDEAIYFIDIEAYDILKGAGMYRIAKTYADLGGVIPDEWADALIRVAELKGEK